MSLEIMAKLRCLAYTSPARAAAIEMRMHGHKLTDETEKKHIAAKASTSRGPDFAAAEERWS